MITSDLTGGKAGRAFCNAGRPSGLEVLCERSGPEGGISIGSRIDSEGPRPAAETRKPGRRHGLADRKQPLVCLLPGAGVLSFFVPGPEKADGSTPRQDPGCRTGGYGALIAGLDFTLRVRHHRADQTFAHGRRGS